MVNYALRKYRAILRRLGTVLNDRIIFIIEDFFGRPGGQACSCMPQGIAICCPLVVLAGRAVRL